MGTLRTEVRNPFALLMRERARAAAWWLNSARRSSLLNLLSTRPGRSGYKPHSPISRPNVLNHIATASPTTDLCLVRGLRPPGRNPCTKCPQSHRHRTSTRASRAADYLGTPTSPSAPNQSVSRRGRRRSQGAMTDQLWFEPFSPHQQAERLLEMGCSSMLEDDKPADDLMARAEPR